MYVIQNKNLKLSLNFIIPIVICPLLIAICVLYKPSESYLIVSLFMCIAILVYFITSFEKKFIGTRRLIVISIMIALSIVGRFIPFFKPIAAISIITALSFGKEAGFMVGAFSVFISNFYFGQGPFTPFQMFAFGLIGLFAGLFNDFFVKHSVALYLYAIVTGILYSVILDVWDVIWYNKVFDIELYKLALYTSIPFSISYSVANVLFIALFKKPFYIKLERVKKVYGI